MALPTILDHLDRLAASRPHDVAIDFEGACTTYAVLARNVEVLSASLAARGVGPSDRVAMLTTPRPEAWTLFLATLRIGGIWLGLNPRHTVPELRHIVHDSEPSLVVSLLSFEGRDYRDDVAQAAQGVDPRPALAFFDDRISLLDAMGDGAPRASAPAVRLPGIESSDGAVLVYTSGTTGRPKGALLSHLGIANGFRFYDEIGPRGRLLCNLPMNHVGGMVDLGCAPFMSGVRLVFMERFDAAKVIGAIDDGRVNVLYQVPTVLQLIVEHPDFRDDTIGKLIAAAFSGAPMPRATIERFRKAGLVMSAPYGSTESTIVVSEPGPDATEEALASTIGRPVPGVEYRIVGADETDVPPGEEGELVIRHPATFKGYWRLPEATAERYTADGYLRTTDLVCERPDGLLELRGRSEEVFKSGGYNVYPREIETALEQHDSVARAVVVDVPDERYFRVGHAFVAPTPGCDVTEPELRAWCRARLANYKVPKSFEVRAELPMLAVGKVDRGALKREATERAEINASGTGR